MNSSPLSNLPLELRLDIYERVLHVEGGVTVTLNKPRTKAKEKKSPKKYKELASSSKQKNLLAISATCKEIARETAGILFSTNDTWTFTSPDDDSTAWGKRVREWSDAADQKNHLRRAKKVQFDLGVRSTRHHFEPMDIPNEAAALFLNLPRVLSQPTITHTIKLTLDWTRGVRLGHKRRERLSPCIFDLPMFGTHKEIRDALHGPLRRQTSFRDLHAEWRKAWAEGTESSAPGTYPPKYPEQFDRLVDDSACAGIAVIDIEGTMCEYADEIGKKLFERSEGLEW